MRNIRVKNLSAVLKSRGVEAGARSRYMADLSGKGQGFWSTLLNDAEKSFGEKLARSTEAFLGIPEGALDDDGSMPPHPKRSRGVAHQLSDGCATIAPTTIDWGSAVSAAEIFRLQILDGAMDGPDYPGLRPGDFADFDPNGLPEPGRGVLVADQDDNLYIRTYQERTPTHWKAVAANKNFDTLDSIADGLRIVAVQCGVAWATKSKT